MSTINKKDLDVKKALDYKMKTMLIEEIQNPPDPWEVFLRLYHKPLPVFLDSCGRGEYSFVAADPFLVICSWDKENRIILRDREDVLIGNPFSLLKGILEGFRIEGSPYPLCGGAIGLLGYDLKNSVEELETGASKDLPLPDLHMGFYDTVFIFHHPSKKGIVASTGLPEKGWRREKRACERLEGLMRDLRRKSLLNPSLTHPPRTIESNFTRDGYIRAIERALSYIERGDIYQINLSQRFSFPFREDPVNLYGILRATHPVPMGAFLRLGRVSLLSNSPERFLRIRKGSIETMPIKGTARRGRSSTEDMEIVEMLKKDPKENAEHTMIVDLERNDLGRVCRYGSVKVTRGKAIETYPTLHHMVSTVRGELKEGVHPVDAIRLCFPGGSVTGAPKIRAMEIIDELEPTARGPYTGAIGYIDFSGNVDLNIAIRTAIVCKGRLFYQAGGGIVADSHPEREYEETLLKAEALLRVVEGARMVALK